MVRRILFVLLAVPGALIAQIPPGVQAERADYAQWLQTSPSSPYAAVFFGALSGELVFGPGAQAALRRAPAATLSQGARGLGLVTESGPRPVPRNREVTLGDWRLRVSPVPSGDMVTVYAPMTEEVDHPGWFPYRADLVVVGELKRPSRADERAILGLDGVEIRASLAGTFTARVLSEDVSLTAYRIPVPGSEEEEVTVFYRDGTSGAETYPPGRFAVLLPLGGGRYRLDLNRSRNPFCAYNPRFPCPLPWPGNTLQVRVEAGELYKTAND
ncbi:MAG: DUF1684 domain-containing protein [Gemmatimonadetes bacterium]|nr:DUF1684 domain-containing protein [Gemmatimonadota bacterium]MDA1103195.1 DUF1684 domain-containing protein [Gemmatimonadota bacterium]